MNTTTTNTTQKQGNAPFYYLSEVPRPVSYTGPIMPRPIEYHNLQSLMNNTSMNTQENTNDSATTKTAKTPSDFFKNKMLYHQCILDGGNDDYCKQFIIKMKND
jgi:hypothetical protein